MEIMTINCVIFPLQQMLHIHNSVNNISPEARHWVFYKTIVKMKREIKT